MSTLVLLVIGVTGAQQLPVTMVTTVGHDDVANHQGGSKVPQLDLIATLMQLRRTNAEIGKMGVNFTRGLYPFSTAVALKGKPKIKFSLKYATWSQLVCEN